MYQFQAATCSSTLEAFVLVVVLFVTLKSWSGRKILDPTTYVLKKWQKKLCTGAFWLRTEASGCCCKSDMVLLIALNIRILLA